MGLVMGETLSKLLKRTRNYIDETAGENQWLDDDGTYQVGLKTLIADEIRSLEMEFRPLLLNYFADEATFNATNGINLYTLPEDFAKLVLLEQVTDTLGNAIAPVTLRPMRTLEEKNKLSSSGVPTHYMIWGDFVVVSPTPNFTATNFFKIWYVKKLRIPVDLSDSSPLPDECNELISLGAAIRALLQTQEPINDLMAIYDRTLNRLISDLRFRNTQEPKHENMYERQLLWPQQQGTS